MPSAFSSCCRPPARTGTYITWRCCRSRSAIWSWARFSTIVTLQLLQALVCVPFMLLRRGYAEINNPVGIEANLAFLGFGFMLMGLFDLVFLPMHYKNGYDLGKPFVISSIVLFFAIVLLEALDHTSRT